MGVAEATGERTEQCASVPEKFLAGEYGKQEMGALNARALVMVSQQRGVHNPSFKQIKESIKQQGLINAVDVALLRRDALESYLRFINKLWGKSHNIDDYMPDADDYYQLVIAGHTRVDAIIEIEDERFVAAQEAGFDTDDQELFPPPLIWAKIYRDQQPADILALQLAENLHEKPSQERTAIAMVETYQYGLEQKSWSNEDEFVAQNEGRFARRDIEMALVFCHLDEDLRTIAFTGQVNYGTMVELAKTIEPHRDYLARKYFETESYDQLDDENKITVNEYVRLWNQAEIIQAQRGRWSVTAARKHFEVFRKNWGGESEDEKEVKENTQPALLDDSLGNFESAQKNWRRDCIKLRAELKRSLIELASSTSEEAMRALDIHMRLFDPGAEEGAEILGKVAGYVDTFEFKFDGVARSSGIIATKEGAIVDPEAA